MAGLARKRKKSNTPVTNRGHSYATSGAAAGGRASSAFLFTTPPPIKSRRCHNVTVLRDQTNNGNWVGGTTNNGTLEEVLSGWGQLTPALVACKLATLLRLAFDKETDIQRTIGLMEDELDLDE
jgi:hypothetical protein